jgi:hypothetical protein
MISIQYLWYVSQSSLRKNYVTVLNFFAEKSKPTMMQSWLQGSIVSLSDRELLTLKKSDSNERWKSEHNRDIQGKTTRKPSDKLKLGLPSASLETKRKRENRTPFSQVSEICRKSIFQAHLSQSSRHSSPQRFDSNNRHLAFQMKSFRDSQWFLLYFAKLKDNHYKW